MIPFPVYWRFPDAFCNACGELVAQEEAVAVYADGKGIGWRHQRDCTRDDA